MVDAGSSRMSLFSLQSLQSLLSLQSQTIETKWKEYLNFAPVLYTNSVCSVAEPDNLITYGTPKENNYYRLQCRTVELLH